MPRSPEATRQALLDAAGRLFADRGPDAVSLAEVNSAARQRNTAAVHYHFGGRDGLLEAVLEPHLARVEARRNEMLDALDERVADDGLESDARGAPLDGLVHALVEPLAELLDDPTGRCFLRIQARMPPRSGPLGRAGRRLVRCVNEHLARTLPNNVVRARGQLVQLLLFPALAEQARRSETRHATRAERDVFVACLIDAVRGVLTTPMGSPTEALGASG